MGVVVSSRGPVRLAVAALLGVAALALTPAAAGAETTCSYDGGTKTLAINMSSPGDSTLLALGPGGAIQVRGGGPVLPCGGATTANTENINVVDGSGSNGNTHVSIFNPVGFAPLEIILAFGGGIHDSLSVFGEAGPAVITIGSGGINSDGDSSSDVNFFGTGPDDMQVFGGEAADTIRARGGSGTGGLPTASSLELGGTGGNDTLEGSEIGDLLTGDAGNDTLRGFGGDDALIGDGLSEADDDSFDGGAGSDTVRTPLALAGISVDLDKTGPQATGKGADSFTEVENLLGTSFDDTLLGSAGPNNLQGEGGDDLVEGRAGEDQLGGGSGTDTLTYAGAPSGVAVNLEAGTAGGGYGTDGATQFENLIGSPFADALTGSKEANVITALAGADTVQALAGADRVEIRDGASDNASCGSEIDTAVSDRLTLDTVQADCEVRDALPEAATGDGGTGGGGAAASGKGSSGVGKPGGNGKSSGKVVLSLRAARRQPLLAQGGLLVKLRCPREACTVAVRVAGRRIRPATVRLAAGAKRTVLLRIRRGKRRAIRRLLLGGTTLRLRVTATASDAAGSSTPAQVVVIASPPRPLS